MPPPSAVLSLDSIDSKTLDEVCSLITSHLSSHPAPSRLEYFAVPDNASCPSSSLVVLAPEPCGAGPTLGLAWSLLPPLHAYAARCSLAAPLLLCTPFHATAWAWRKRAALCHGDGIAGALAAELSFVNLVQSRHPKAAEAWEHRAWAARTLCALLPEPAAALPVLRDELRACAAAIALRPRNYAAHTHSLAAARAVFSALRRGAGGGEEGGDIEGGGAGGDAEGGAGSLAPLDGDSASEGEAEGSEAAAPAACAAARFVAAQLRASEARVRVVPSDGSTWHTRAQLLALLVLAPHALAALPNLLAPPSPPRFPEGVPGVPGVHGSLPRQLLSETVAGCSDDPASGVLLLHRRFLRLVRRERRLLAHCSRVAPESAGSDDASSTGAERERPRRDAGSSRRAHAAALAALERLCDRDAGTAVSGDSRTEVLA